MNDAFGRASRMCRAKPSMKSYWLRWASSAITTMLRRSESSGYRSPFSSGKNFWMVVKTTPPDATCSSSPQVVAALGLHRRLPQQFVAAREGAEELVVQVVAVGEDDDRRVLHRRMQNQPPGVEKPSSGSCPILACARPRRIGLSPRGRVAATVVSTALLTAWNWW